MRSRLCTVAGALAALALTVPTVPAFAGARMLSNFPVTVKGGIHAAPVVADLDGDGRLDVAVGAGSTVTAISGDGQVLAGFPVDLGAEIVGPLAAADVDGDGKAELLAVTANGMVALLHGDGTEVDGFPMTLAGGARAGGALLDLDHRGRPDVVVGGKDGRLHVFVVPRGARRRRGRKAGPPKAHERRGFPATIGADVTSAPALADLGGKRPAWCIVVGAADGGVHVVDSRGRARRGFPVKSRYLVTGTPAVGDIDGDGAYDIVFASQDFHLYAVDATGKALSGFPVKTSYRIYGGPALIDLDGNGLPDVVFASGDGGLYAVDGTGRMLRGFPVDLGARVEGPVVAGDIDGNGRPEIIVATADGRIHAIERDGRPLAGFHARLRGKVGAGVTLSDFVADGYVEILAGDLEGRLVVFKETSRSKAAPSLAWPTAAHDAARTGRLHPTPSRFLDLAVLPASPITTDTLKATWRYVDADREPAGKVEVRWYANGKRVADLDGARSVPPARTKKGERWRFSVREVRDGPAAHWFRSPETRIVDAPPSAPAIGLVPESPHTGDELSVRIVRPAADPDGDRVSYRYRWARDGVPVKLPASTAALAAGRIKKGERWDVSVRAFDGTLEGKVVRTSATVVNSAPTAPGISLSPSAPSVTSVIVAHVTKPSVDRDHDPLAYRYRWTVDGAPAGVPDTADRLPAGLAHKGDAVAVAVAADDGDVLGPSASATVKLHDTPPSAPEVTIRPAHPVTGQALLAEVSRPATDPDHDAVHYETTWQLDGKPAPVSGPLVPGAKVHAGQQWTVRVVAHDDETAGGSGKASVTVDDSPPTAPVVEVKPAAPLPGEPLSLVVLTPASDPDGDAVTLDVAWTVGGKQAATGRAVPAGRTQKGERWTVTVTPHDAKLAGEPARASVTIGNRPPPAPTVGLSPARPLGGQAIRAVVHAAPDPDGDKVTLLERWRLDGKPVARLDGASEVPAKEVRRGQVWSVTVVATDGEARSGAVQATARVGDRPPVPPAVVVEPGSPRTTDALTCKVEKAAHDPDGDATSTVLHWRRGGQPTGFAGATLPAPVTRRGERWSCVGEVRAGGVSVGGAPSADVAVADSAPTRPGVVVEPAHARTGDALTCALAAPSTDADGDRLSYRYAWWRNGHKLADRTGATVPGRLVHKGDTWSCTATPGDGTKSGPAGHARLKVGNTAPGAPGVAISPDAPAPGQDIHCSVTQAATDADGDRLTYGFRWYLDGEVQPFAPTAMMVRGRLVKAGAQWQCGVVAEDGTTTGREARTRTVTVGPHAVPGPVVGDLGHASPRNP